jgi:hypothetical protein
MGNAVTTQRPVFIKGYLIDLDKYCEYYQLDEDERPHHSYDVEGSHVEETGYTVIGVCRAYDSVELDDFPIYAVKGYYMPEYGELTSIDMQRIHELEKMELDNPMPYMIKSETGLFMDSYDADRGVIELGE